MGAQDSRLLMGHGENAVPAGWRFVKKIFLTTLPVGACRAVVGPLVKNGLERGLGVKPAALLKEGASLVKTIEAVMRSGRIHNCGMGPVLVVSEGTVCSFSQYKPSHA